MTAPVFRGNPAPSSPVAVSLDELIRLRTAAAGLSFRAVRVKGGQGGGHLSQFRGRGMEFDEARPYQSGDDLRTIDWRVTARTGKPYTKLFREERDRSVFAWLDLRPPMGFATQGRFKSVRAAQTAALVAWTALAESDRFGGLVFDHLEHREYRPALGHRPVLHFLQHVAAHAAWAGAATGPAASNTSEQALARLQRVARPGSLVFLLSDFRDLGDDVKARLTQIARHADLVAILFSDVLERELPPPDTYRVRVGGGSVEVDASRSAARRAYRMGFEARAEQLATLANHSGFHFLQCSTEQDPVDVLMARFRRR